jgi:hypothetical protein
MNTKVKGQRNQRKALKILEEENYITAIVERTGKFVHPKDAFSLFDICAKKNNIERWIQIKTNSTGGFIKKLKEFAKYYPIPGVSYELWVWYDRKGFKIYKF